MLEMAGGCAPDDCQFPLIEIGDDPMPEPDDPLQPGMEVMAPCENCGMTANEYMAFLDKSIKELEDGFKSKLEHENIPLFHWSPSKNRNGITKLGLVPGRKPTTHADVQGWRAPYTCFATDPAWAWALSGNMGYAPDGEWDLWQTWWNELTEPEILPAFDGDGIHEVRTSHRVFKRSVKYLGSRTKL